MSLALCAVGPSVCVKTVNVCNAQVTLQTRMESLRCCECVGYWRVCKSLWQHITPLYCSSHIINSPFMAVLLCQNCYYCAKNLTINCACGLLCREIIEKYYWDGFQYREIILFLDHYHGIVISLRTLLRRLSAYGLRRRTQPACLRRIWDVVNLELTGPGMSRALFVKI